jgi:hypothetical protein
VEQGLIFHRRDAEGAKKKEIAARVELKKVGLLASEIKQLAPGRGGCHATDMITVFSVLSASRRWI